MDMIKHKSSSAIDLTQCRSFDTIRCAGCRPALKLGDLEDSPASSRHFVVTSPKGISPAIGPRSLQGRLADPDPRRVVNLITEKVIKSGYRFAKWICIQRSIFPRAFVHLRGIVLLIPEGNFYESDARVHRVRSFGRSSARSCAFLKMRDCKLLNLNCLCLATNLQQKRQIIKAMCAAWITTVSGLTGSSTHGRNI